MEFLTALQELITYLQIFFSSPVTMYAIMVGVIAFLSRSKSIKSFRLGNFISFEGKDDTGKHLPRSITNCRDVKHYKLILNEAINGNSNVLDDIRYRVRRNGWEKRTDWEQYVSDAIQSHRDALTRVIDLEYSEESMVERLDLYDHNQKISNQVVERYRRMYANMYLIFIDHYKEIDKLNAELESVTTHCDGKQGPCLTYAQIAQKLNEIHYIRDLKVKEMCMNEAERAVKEIMQMYYSTYLTIFKKTMEKNNSLKRKSK